jgi:hypothetical protein
VASAFADGVGTADTGGKVFARDDGADALKGAELAALGAWTTGGGPGGRLAAAAEAATGRMRCSATAPSDKRTNATMPATARIAPRRPLGASGGLLENDDTEMLDKPSKTDPPSGRVVRFVLRWASRADTGFSSPSGGGGGLDEIETR